MSYPHKSVLLEEVLEVFKDQAITTFIDATLGAGGHSEALLKNHPEIKKLIGIDQDLEAIKIAKERLKNYPVEIIHSNFSTAKLPKSNGILADLGVSSMQLDQAERGFSFMRDGPLDMRMNQKQELTAALIVNEWDERDIAVIIRDYGEEKRWKEAARAIVRNRPFHTTLELAAVLKKALYNPKKKIDPSTQVFQALRIRVNDELEVIKTFIKRALDSLEVGGRLAIITFHSLEDRIVKHTFRDLAQDKVTTKGLGGLFLPKVPEVKILTPKGIIASDDEIQLNPRSRSAKLRAVEKCACPIDS